MRRETRHNHGLQGNFAGHLSKWFHANIQAEHGLNSTLGRQTGQLGSRHQRVSRNRFRAQPVNREPGNHELGTVRQNEHDSITRTDSQFLQSAGSLPDSVEQILVRVARSEIAKRDSVRIPLDRRLKQLLNTPRRVLNLWRNSQRVRLMPGGCRRTENRRHRKWRISKITSGFKRYSFYW